MGRLTGKVAIVTGGAGGIGSATCRKLAAEGASVAVFDINLDGATAVAADIEAASGEAIAVRIDLSSEDEVAAAIGATVDRFGRLDVVHNNAALTDNEFLSRDTAVTDLDIEVWDTTLDVNLRSQMLMCKHAVPAMVAHGGGSIMNMSSGAAFSGDMTRTAYGVSKAGVHALSMYVATSHGKQGIRVNTIVPGLIITEAVRAHIPADMVGKLGRAVLTPELGRPEDIADLVVFLASDESRYITGQSITIDGGMTAHSGQSSQSND
jgi:NAD(P)-dependent dehydrogenase (short-subunit alcohol dehydrogenase family)